MKRTSAVVAAREFVEQLPQLHFLRGQSPLSGLKMACGFALNAEMPGDEASKLHDVLQLKRSDIDPDDGTIRSRSDVHLSDKTKRMVLAQYHAQGQSADDNDYLLPFLSRRKNSTVYQSTNHFKRDIAAYVRQTEQRLNRTDARAAYWRYLER